MFDIYWGDIELTTLVLILSIVVVLPVQLLLCFKGKSRTVRLLPAILFGGLAAVLVLMSTTASGWDGIGYVLLAMLSALMLLPCGVGWGIWAIVFFRKKLKSKSQI